MKFHVFPDLFRYQFWLRFRMSFGINFGSILEAFLSLSSMLFRERFLIDFYMAFFFGFGTKKSSKSQHSGERFDSLFPSFFDPAPQGGVCEGSLAYFGTFWLHLVCFGYLFGYILASKILPVGTRICRHICDQPYLYRAPADNRRQPPRRNRRHPTTCMEYPSRSHGNISRVSLITYFLTHTRFSFWRRRSSTNAPDNS